MTKTDFIRLSILTGFCILAVPFTVNGQAYCALRDPTRQIYGLYQDATSYRSIVRTVGEEARSAITAQIPFPMHFTELGKHTLYVVVENQKPIGFVHARSERSEWGLVEIVWALDLNLNILDYRFQRCRSSHRDSLESDEIRSQIHGKGFGDILGLLSEDGRSLRPNGLSVPGGSERLAAVVLRCALKTIAATGSAWPSDVMTARSLSRAMRSFPQTRTTLLIDTPYPPDVLRDLKAVLKANSSGINRSNLIMDRAVDENGNPLGVIVMTDCRVGTNRFKIWWSIDNTRTITGLEVDGRWKDRLTEEAFTALHGLSLEDMTAQQECSDPAQLIATEVLVTASHHMGEE